MFKDRVWEAFDPPVAGTESGDLQLAKATLAGGQPRRALKMLKVWVEQYPNSFLTAEALFYQGDCYLQAKDYHGAFKKYEEMLDRYAGTELFERAISRELKIAQLYLDGAKRKFLGMRIAGAKADGVEILIRIQERAPGTAAAEEALIMLADDYYKIGQFGSDEEGSAEEYYAQIIQQYPGSRYRRKAQLRLAQCAMGRFRGVRFDETPLLDARERIDQYVRAHPRQSQAHELSAALRRLDWAAANKDFQIADYYQRTGAAKAAAYYYRLLIREYSQTEWAQQASVRLRDMGFPDQVAPEKDPAKESSK